MLNVLSNKVVYCKKCKKYIEYTKDEIKKKKDVYYAYGCEANYFIVKYIECPICKKHIEIEKLF